jgi:hypothetical protein
MSGTQQVPAVGSQDHGVQVDWRASRARSEVFLLARQENEVLVAMQVLK